MVSEKTMIEFYLSILFPSNISDIHHRLCFKPNFLLTLLSSVSFVLAVTLCSRSGSLINISANIKVP